MSFVTFHLWELERGMSAGANGALDKWNICLKNLFFCLFVCVLPESLYIYIYEKGREGNILEIF